MDLKYLRKEGRCVNLLFDLAAMMAKEEGVEKRGVFHSSDRKNIKKQSIKTLKDRFGVPTAPKHSRREPENALSLGIANGLVRLARNYG